MSIASASIASTFDAGIGTERGLNGGFQRAAMIRMPLGGKIRIVALAQNRIGRRAEAQPTALAVDDRNPDARRPEINASDDGHARVSSSENCRGNASGGMPDRQA